MKFSGLRARLLLLLGVAVLPAVALLLTGRSAERRATIRELQTQALNLARLTGQAHAQRVEQGRQLLLALAANPIIAGRDLGACNLLAQKLTTAYAGIYATVGRAKADDGVVDCLALEGAPPEMMPSLLGMSIRDRDYFLHARDRKTFAVGDFIQGKIRREPILAFAVPLQESGRVTHVVFANFDLVVLSRALEAEVRLEGAAVSLLDRNGVLIARSSEAERYFGSRHDAILQAMRGQREMVTTTDDGTTGVGDVLAASSVRDSDGTLIGYATVRVSGGNLSRLLGLASSEWLTIGVLALGLLLVAFIGSELLILRPVARLVGATEGLAAGELGVRAPVGGSRELQALANALNQMAGKLRERELHLREGQRLEAIGQLAGGIAHDFNNLLTVIIGYADVLKDSLPPGSVEAGQIKVLRGASERAARLTQQLLAFSRRQVLLPTPLQLNEVVHDMTTLLRRTTGGDIVIDLALDPQLGLVYADRVQMEQVILNLVINARDAMPKGGELRIATGNVAEGPMVELSVTDTGDGMDDATRSRIFEPFFTTKGSQGTGLGLATVYGIVKQSEGQIECDSTPGQGTTFRIRLPKYAGAIAVVETERVPHPVGGTETVLLVDDDDAVRDVLAMVLQRHGYKVRVTGKATEALRWMSAGWRPDILVTDVRMPDMNGVVFARAAREHAPALKVILMSGDAAPSLAGQDQIAGATFEQKPVSAPALLRSVRSRLDE